MKINNINYKIMFCAMVLFCTNYSTYAQDRALKLGTNSTMKHASSILELEADNKGLLIPRVQLSGIMDVTTIAAPSNALLIYNVAAAGTAPNDVMSGFYYYSSVDARWIRVFDTNTVHEPWNVQGSQNQATSNTQNIYQAGSVSIGANVIPNITIGGSTITPKFHVAGDISTTGKLWTTNSVYADYVFEKYFDGFSKLNEEYQFKTLEEVASFVKEFKHLPGVTPIKDIQSDENGYTIDLTNLSMQQLEKIEELYLHTIEQQVQIKKLNSEIDSLKERFNRLEKSISDKSKK